MVSLLFQDILKTKLGQLKTNLEVDYCAPVGCYMLVWVLCGVLWGLRGRVWCGICSLQGRRSSLSPKLHRPGLSLPACLPTSPRHPVAPVPGLFPEGCPCGEPVGFVGCAGREEGGAGCSVPLTVPVSSALTQALSVPSSAICCHHFPSRTELTRWFLKKRHESLH